MREAPWRRSERSSSPTSATSPTCRSSRCSCRRATPWHAEDPLVTLESDKATMDVPAPFGGTVGGDQGQRRRHGLGGLADPRAAGPRPTARSRSRQPSRRRRRGRGRTAPAAEAPPVPASPQADAGRGRGRRAALREPGGAAPRPRAGVDLSAVEGSGRKGRITKEDVRAAAEAAPAARGADRCAGHRAGPRAVAEGRLREVRRGRAPAAARASRRSAARTWPATG